MSEFELIARLAPHLAGAGGPVVVGHGDDAAVLRLPGVGVALTVDVLVDGVHFRRDLSSPADVGWKAVAVNCSDLAAMAARPLAAVVGLCRPPGTDAGDLEAIYDGMAAACRRWGLRLVGGDTVGAGVLSLSLTALGEVDPEGAIRRSGARPGDRLVLVGELGAAAAALAQVDAGVPADPRLLRAHRRPRALVDAGQALARHGARALIDVSDGLGADLGHVCAASGVRARVSASDLPVAAGVAEAAAAAGVDALGLACGGGEDFALLACVPASSAEAAARAGADAEGVPAAVVGEVLAADRPGPRVLLTCADGSTRDLDGLGYDHLSGERAAGARDAPAHYPAALSWASHAC